MSASVPQLVPEPVAFWAERNNAPLRVPVDWSSTGFDCGINQLPKPGWVAEGAFNALEPVLLRVSEAAADSCRVEFFCAAAWLCGASAGC